MQPANRPRSSSRISTGSRQLLVGPASTSRSQQMKVRSSTRATSAGSERARKDLGRRCGSSGSKVPASTSVWQSCSNASTEPSNQRTSSGVVSAATSSTQDSSRACLVAGVASITTSPPPPVRAGRLSRGAGHASRGAGHPSRGADRASAGRAGDADGRVRRQGRAEATASAPRRWSRRWWAVSRRFIQRTQNAPQGAQAAERSEGHRAAPTRRITRERGSGEHSTTTIARRAHRMNR